MQVQLDAYLHFNGHCREAMTFYQACFGGELILHKISDSPMAALVSSKKGTNILRGVLTSEKIRLFGSDVNSVERIKGNSVTLLLTFKNEVELKNVFRRLSSGGVVSSPLHSSVWGDVWGEVIDKYGINWKFQFSRNHE